MFPHSGSDRRFDVLFNGFVDDKIKFFPTVRAIPKPRIYEHGAAIAYSFVTEVVVEVPPTAAKDVYGGVSVDHGSSLESNLSACMMVTAARGWRERNTSKSSRLTTPLKRKVSTLQQHVPVG